MKTAFLSFMGLLSINYSIADTCPIADLEGQKFRRTELRCNDSDQDSCFWLDKHVAAVGIFIKERAWGETHDMYVVAHSRDVNLPENNRGGMVFYPQHKNWNYSSCTKSVSPDGSITYRFSHTYCSPCRIEEFVVSGNKAFYRIGSELAPTIGTFEKF